MLHLLRMAACRSHSLNKLQSYQWTVALRFHIFNRPKSTGSILKQSTLLLQDGLDIQEMPLVIRQMTASEFPFYNTSYTCNHGLKATEEENMFSIRLEACKSVVQVLELLEVPGDHITAYSAAFALQRLFQLQSSGTVGINSFIKKAIFNELFETVIKDIDTLGNEMLLNIKQFCWHSSNFGVKYLELIVREVEKRIGDGKFTMSELCSLVEILSVKTNLDSLLLDNVWIHIGSRYQEIDENTIAMLYSSFNVTKSKQKYLIRLFNKKFSTLWWKLDASDISKIMVILKKQHHLNTHVLTAVGKWLFINIQQVNDDQLKNILKTYYHFNHIDDHGMAALERYVSVKASTMNKSLIALIMECCRKKSYLSHRIFNAVSADFAENSVEYSIEDVLYSLRPFGQLNYSPPNAAHMFRKVETFLLEKFTEFDPAALLELLASFTYIERYPVNFIHKIFAPHFLTRIRAVCDEKNQQDVTRHLLEIQSAMTMESTKMLPRYNIVTDVLSMSRTWIDGRYMKFHVGLGKQLEKLIGPWGLSDLEMPHGTPHLINFEIRVGSKGHVLHVGSKTVTKKLAILGIMPDDYCVNCHHLLGRHVMKQRHLKLKGYTVVEILYKDFMWKHRSYESRQRYLTDTLSPHLIINAPSD